MTLPPSPPTEINFPVPDAPIADPQTGVLSVAWRYFFQRLLTRTGGGPGINVATVEAEAEAAQNTANIALSSAESAQTTANTAITDAAAAQTTATDALANAAGAQTTANTAIADVAAETARALAAEALLAPKASPTFTGVATSPEYAVGTPSGPTWTTGTGVPGSTQPQGSFYSRVGGAVGSTFYVSQGGGVWNAVAGV